MATRMDLALGGAAIKPTEHVLDGRRYLITVRWMGRASTWFMDIRSSDGTMLLAGVPIRVGQNIIRPHVSAALPGNGYGAIIPLDTSMSGRDPTRTDLGSRVKVYYMTAAEVQAL